MIISRFANNQQTALNLPQRRNGSGATFFHAPSDAAMTSQKGKSPSGVRFTLRNILSKCMTCRCEASRRAPRAVAA